MPRCAHSPLAWPPLHEVVIAVVLFEVRLIKVLELHLVAHQSTNAAEALAKLVALLGPVGDELELCAKALVSLHDPLDEQLVVNDIQLHTSLRIAIKLCVLRLLRSHEKDLLRISVGIADLDALQLYALPDDEGLHRTHVQALHRVFVAKAVLAGVLRHFIQKLCDQLLLLHELYVLQRLSGELNGLVEAILTSIGNVQHGLDDDGVEARVPQVACRQLCLKVCRASNDEACDVRLGICDKALGGDLADLPDVIVPLLQAQPRKTEGGLTAATVLLWQLD
mmetsp:Transcript_65180/g.180799  ORF Transcript_65180/g.180799 Transcript_65180/m.180799 type:complete len:280 (+) Transcript_65180:288-1127(+)